jgi:hypothetical protein
MQRSSPEIQAAADTAEPRWPAALAVLAAAALFAALPASLRFGPYWLAFAGVAALLIPTVAMHRAGRHSLNQFFGYATLAILTAAMVSSVGFLVARLPANRDQPQVLLRSAAILWIANVLVFASWYWRLDAGGPHSRDQRASHTEGAFLFPQMILPSHKDRGWRPGFIDYLFLAFNSSTAFSPTDSPVLTRWAKAMMMIQALISLTTIAVLAARAINILPSK